MLSGDNSILQKATEAKEITEKNQIIEQARLDILGEIASEKGEDPTETKIKEILVTYFTIPIQKYEDTYIQKVYYIPHKNVNTPIDENVKDNKYYNYMVES